MIQFPPFNSLAPYLRSSVTPAQTAANAWETQAIALGASPPADTKTALQTFFGSLLASTGSGGVGFTLADVDYMTLMIGSNGSDTATNQYNQKRINVTSPGTFDFTVVNANASGHVAGGTLGDGSMIWKNGFNFLTQPVNRATAAWMWIVITGVGALADRTGHANFLNHYVRGSYSSNRMGAHGTNVDLAVAGAVTPAKLLLVEASVSGVRLYQGATSIASSALAGTAIPSDKQASIFGVINESEVAFQIGDMTLAAAGYGKNGSPTQLANFYAALQTLMAAFSVTI